MSPTTKRLKLTRGVDVYVAYVDADTSVEFALNGRSQEVPAETADALLALDVLDFEIVSSEDRAAEIAEDKEAAAAAAADRKAAERNAREQAEAVERRKTFEKYGEAGPPVEPEEPEDSEGTDELEPGDKSSDDASPSPAGATATPEAASGDRIGEK